MKDVCACAAATVGTPNCAAGSNGRSLVLALAEAGPQAPAPPPDASTCA